MHKRHYSIETILSNLNIESLNEMQEASLEATKKHDNVMVLSATGSGKTLAFLLPMLQHIEGQNKNTQAMVIVPSRELALQIEQVFRTMGTGLKVTCCYGGHKREIEENSLIQPPAVIIGTPGRLADHIRRGNITVETIETVVLDEFDKSLELGFQEEVASVIAALTNIKRRILTSATQAVEVPDFVGASNLEQLNFLSAEEAPKASLAIQSIVSDDKDKIETLFQLLCFIGNRSTIIFCNHRESVERVHKLLSEKGIINTFYHGAMEQREREVALAKFRNGSIQSLVTTDLAARGLDITNIRYIIHYHLPATEDIFTHRNGRTARMDASGTAILILNREETIPSYITAPVEELAIPVKVTLPEKSKWVTLFVGAGKKDKVNKVDIVGFLTNKGKLKKEDVGLIEVKDFFSFVAVRRNLASHTLHLIKNEKIKGKKVKIEIAK